MAAQGYLATRITRRVSWASVARKAKIARVTSVIRVASITRVARKVSTSRVARKTKRASIAKMTTLSVNLIGCLSLANLNFCQLFSSFFNIMSAVFARQSLAGSQKIDSRGGLF